jgi:hypothetical protein
VSLKLLVWDQKIKVKLENILKHEIWVPLYTAS